MSKQLKNMIVPTLRFPTFEKSWEYEILGPYLEEYLERVSAKTELPVFSSSRTGLYPQKDYYDGRQLINEGEYGVVPEGYFVYRHMSDDTVFKFNINKNNGKIAVSKEYPVFRTVNLNSDFLLYKLNEGEDFKKFAIAQKKGGTRTRLYFKTLCSWETFLPTLEEQKKIADCLCSIDELINVQIRKSAVFKAYKKGLMQQLFPEEGEVIPKIRFPEFREAGVWGEDFVGNVCRSFSGGTPPTEQKEYYGGDIPFIRSAEIDEERTELYLTDEGLRNSAAKLVKKGDILFALYGANSGDVALARQDGAINQAVLCLQSTYSHAFIHQFLIFKKGWITAKYIQGGQGNLSGEIVKSISIQIPTLKEQQKIGDCLSSIDDLITVQGQKIDALKKYKKGLMQQLFPAINNIDK